MSLPKEFLNKMKNLLEENEYEAFVDSYSCKRYYGLRVNTLKISVKDFLKISPFELKPIPWTKDGFYYEEGENPGKHPHYYAGLYYIQEPSAMFPGSIIDAKPGEKVLDLCAAPGGKTVQIAADMKNEGLLVANDISSDRIKALIKNIELCGIKNTIVTNETPEKLSKNFECYFDKIMVDAPCSGEGMFRKDCDAIKSWGKYKSETCVEMQKEILECVDNMLKPNGYFVYSTCTFSPEENEKMISAFLNIHSNYEIIEINKVQGIEDGRPNFSDGNIELKKTARLWPHRLKGEGHYAAILRKKGFLCNTKFLNSYDILNTYGTPVEVENFIKENLRSGIGGKFIRKGNNIYNLQVELPDLRGIKVAKFGWYLGEIKNGRFIPSHSMATALKKEQIATIANFSGSSREILSYLKGETLMKSGEKGYNLVLVDGYSIGWAKQTGDMLKNLYPKGWRKQN